MKGPVLLNSPGNNVWNQMTKGTVKMHGDNESENIEKSKPDK
jgi:hypothetical protein